MGVRESLLNTITSVADSDFVRIVTSAGASSKATVRNMFKGFESNLSAKSSLTTSDYIRVVGSDNEAYKQLVSDVAKKIIENYTGSSLAGSSQSVKNALDSLNRKTSVYALTSSESLLDVANNDTICPINSVSYVNCRNGNTPGIPNPFGTAFVIKRVSGAFVVVLFQENGNIHTLGHTVSTGYGSWKAVAMS